MIDCGLNAEKDNLTYFEWYQRQILEGEDWENEVDWDTTAEEDIKLLGAGNDI